LTAKGLVTKRDELRHATLFARVKQLGAGVSPQELAEAHIAAIRGELGQRNAGVSEYEKRFFKYMTTAPTGAQAESVERELRAVDMLGNVTGISYSGANGGGYLVPPSFTKQFVKGLAQVDPLLDEDVVTLQVSPDYSSRGGSAAQGWDLSTYSAVRVGGTSSDGSAIQQTSQTVPVTSAEVLSGYLYRTSLAATLELIQDADPAEFQDKISQAYAVAMARGIGVDLVTGLGSSQEQPFGILAGAVDSGLHIGTGAEQSGGQPALNVTAEDLTNFYFSLNRIHRANPKCAWVMADEEYQRIRLAVDNMGRPLIHISEDGETLFGKPVYVAPSMPYANGSPRTTGKIVFGNLSQFIVRCSTLSISKATQHGGGAGSVERGEWLYQGRMRADSQVFDPTNGSVPPVIYATTN
jgi:HK97 family phage major capsid protein